MKRSIVMMSVLASVWLAATAARAAGAGGEIAPRERWYVAQMDGKKMGWMHDSLEVTDEGYLTKSETELRIARGPGSVTVTLASEFLETTDGEPIRMRITQKMASTVNAAKYEFREDGVHVETFGAGEGLSRVEPLPEGEWLTPVEAERFIAARLHAGAKSIRLRTIEPFYGLSPMWSEYEIVGETTAEAMGKAVPAIEWKVSVDSMPGIAQTEFVDREGELIRSVTDLGGLKVTMLASDKALALAPYDAPEMMASTLVKADRDLSDHMRAHRASFILKATNGELPDLVEGGAQRVDRIGPGEARITVDLDDPVDLVAGSIDPEEYLRATTAANTSDEKIQRLAEEALEGVARSPLAKAHQLVSFVSEYITEKSLDVGFATASEVCRTREGDCSEHAVLLAALLRADGIPGRVVSGLVYVPEFLGKQSVFGYHMWTQALIRNDQGVQEWIDLDAAFPMNALHIALDTSSLADDESMNSMVTLARVLGNLEIEVESVE